MSAIESPPSDLSSDEAPQSPSASSKVPSQDIVNILHPVSGEDLAFAAQDINANVLKEAFSCKKVTMLKPSDASGQPNPGKRLILFTADGAPNPPIPPRNHPLRSEYYMIKETAEESQSANPKVSKKELPTEQQITAALLSALVYEPTIDDEIKCIEDHAQKAAGIIECKETLAEQNLLEERVKGLNVHLQALLRDKPGHNIAQLCVGVTPCAVFLLAKSAASENQEAPTLSSTTYVAIRGTVSGADWASNANILLTNTAYGPVHSGFWNAAQTLPTLSIWEDCKQENRRLVLCGHSRGGAIAHMACAQLLIADPAAANAVFAVGFGCPSVGSEDFSNSVVTYGIQSNFISFINGDDPVPRLMTFTQTVLALEAEGRERIATVASYAQEVVRLASLIGIQSPLFSAVTSALNIAWNALQPLLSSLPAHLPKFVPHGLCVFIQRKKRHDFCDGHLGTVTHVIEFQPVDSKNASKLLGKVDLSNRAIQCHFVDRYLERVRRFYKESEFEEVPRVEHISLCTSFFPKITSFAVQVYEGYAIVTVCGEHLETLRTNQAAGFFFQRIGLQEFAKELMLPDSIRRGMVCWRLEQSFDDTHFLLEEKANVRVRNAFGVSEAFNVTEGQIKKYIRNNNVSAADSKLSLQLFKKAFLRGLLESTASKARSNSSESNGRSLLLSALTKLVYISQGEQARTKFAEILSSFKVKSLQCAPNQQMHHSIDSASQCLDDALPYLEPLPKFLAQSLVLTQKRSLTKRVGLAVAVVVLAGVGAFLTFGGAAALVGGVAKAGSLAWAGQTGIAAAATTAAAEAGVTVGTAAGGLAAAGGGLAALFEKYAVKTREAYQAKLRQIKAEIAPTDAADPQEEYFLEELIISLLHDKEVLHQQFSMKVPLASNSITTFWRHKDTVGNPWIPDSEFSKLTGQANGMVSAFLEGVYLTHGIRQLLCNTCVIGFMGVNQSGKSLLIRQLFDVETTTSHAEVKEAADGTVNVQPNTNSTTTDRCFFVHPLLSVLDMPGNTDISSSKVRNIYKLSSAATSLKVVVLHTTMMEGSAAVVADAKDMCSNDSEMLVLVTKADQDPKFYHNVQHYRDHFANQLGLASSQSLFLCSLYQPHAPPGMSIKEFQQLMQINGVMLLEDIQLLIRNRVKALSTPQNQDRLSSFFDSLESNRVRKLQALPQSGDINAAVPLPLPPSHPPTS